MDMAVCAILVIMAVTTVVVNSACIDADPPKCQAWAALGYCTGSHAEYMKGSCQLSCRFCSGGTGSGSFVPKLTHSCGSVRALPADVRNLYRFSAFYTKYTEAYGIPIVSSSRVPDAALQRACYDVRFLYADRKDIRDAYVTNGAFHAVMAKTELGWDIPGQEYMKYDKTIDWRPRRGNGPTDSLHVSVAAEENLLCYRDDTYSTEDIGVHEFAHGYQILGLRRAIPGFDNQLTNLFNSAKSKGLWANTYAGSHYLEYFAEALTIYHNQGRCGPNPPDGIQNHVCKRDLLASYDRDMYNLMRTLFPCNNPFYTRCGAQGTPASQRMFTTASGGANGPCVALP